MIASRMPKMEEQERFYRSVLKHSQDRPVTFRALDIGGDKVIPYFRAANEENPALGWRAMRLALDRPGIIRMQIRALLKATGGEHLRLMFPMVTEIEEFRTARSLIAREVSHLSRFGHDLPRRIELGVMLEVPSLMWQLDELMKEADFVSVGSNDLFQFTMAVDRGNAMVSDRFDPLGKTFLRVLRQIVLAADAAGTPLTLCGEMAGRPLSAMALIALGFRSISMSPAAIGPVKSMLLSLDVCKLRDILLPAIENSQPAEPVRKILTDFADRNGVPL
jgi:phosphotransferase system enzyme I (PtsP)